MGCLWSAASRQVVSARRHSLIVTCVFQHGERAVVGDAAILVHSEDLRIRQKSKKMMRSGSLFNILASLLIPILFDES